MYGHKISILLYFLLFWTAGNHRSFHYAAIFIGLVALAGVAGMLIFLLPQTERRSFLLRYQLLPSNSRLKAYKFTGIINKKESLTYNLNIISLTNKIN